MNEFPLVGDFRLQHHPRDSRVVEPKHRVRCLHWIFDVVAVLQTRAVSTAQCIDDCCESFYLAFFTWNKVSNSHLCSSRCTSILVCYIACLYLQEVLKNSICIISFSPPHLSVYRRTVNTCKRLETSSSDIPTRTSPECTAVGSKRGWIPPRICISVGTQTNFLCFPGILSWPARESARCNFVARGLRWNISSNSTAARWARDRKSFFIKKNFIESC